MRITKLIFFTSFIFVACIFFSISRAHAVSFAPNATPTVIDPVSEKLRTLESITSIDTLLSDVAPTPILLPKGTCPQAAPTFTATGRPEAKEYFLKTINATAGLPASYVPPGLVDVSTVILTNNQTICLESSTAANVARMAADMAKEDLSLVAVSGYRSYSMQSYLYDLYAPTLNTGLHHRVAPSGHSEHQLGTTLDVSSEVSLGKGFANSPESTWIKDNAHLYGFIISYPDGSEDKTGYMYEPWHLRYVGVENATLLHRLNYTLAFRSLYYEAPLLNNVLSTLKQQESEEGVAIGG